LVALVAAMFLVPADFELQGKGSLEPVVKREIFAGVDGRVVRIEPNAEQGKMVEEGEVLIRMESPELEVQMEDVRGRIANTLGEQQSAIAERSKLKRSTPADSVQYAKLSGEIAKAEQSLASLREQLRILDEKYERLLVRSPMTGEILTWQPRELLSDRPLKRGDKLLTVADPAQDWELEIRMPDYYMGHILRARQELRERMRREGKPADEIASADLDVEFVVMTDPGVTRWGTIREIHSIAEVKGDSAADPENVVLIRVKIDKNDLETMPRPGASVTAKIHCGRTSLGYSLFHDLISWFQSRVMFRF
jgi:hypothetical protein